MAKDGTSRGGSRIGSGKKPTKSKKVQALNNNILETVELDAPSEIEGVDIPPIKEYLKAKEVIKWKQKYLNLYQKSQNTLNPNF